ncbi:MAG: hypothetical protein OXH82_05235 [Candidatus Dadabacteria bacterium]|nr:hypothetical protein [Candidatus Dadabacteria bacterium]MDE0663309.1 hypothetical protein [Candidatus Dadabacteria bacterium]
MKFWSYPNPCKDDRVPENARIHKFVVAHGVEETLKKFSGKDYSGSLAISYGEHAKPSAERPSCVKLSALGKALEGGKAMA